MAEYIDRDEALHALGEFPLAWEYGAGVKDCYEALEKVPVADVAPVRHGHWRGKPTGRYEVLKCSVCGDCSPTAGIMPRFCPNCGAKMDLEVVP